MFEGASYETVYVAGFCVVNITQFAACVRALCACTSAALLTGLLSLSSFSQGSTRGHHTHLWTCDPWHEDGRLGGLCGYGQA
jgi:hypothetical protein